MFMILSVIVNVHNVVLYCIECVLQGVRIVCVCSVSCDVCSVYMCIVVVPHHNWRDCCMVLYIVWCVF